MRIVEGEIGSKKISFRSVNCSAAPSEVKHQVLYVENGLKNAFSLAVIELADERRSPKRDGQCDSC